MSKPLHRSEFESAEQFFSAVVAADSGARTMDSRLTMQAVASGQFEGGGSAGQFLAPEEFAAQLWTRTYATGQLLARCARQPVTRNELRLPAIAESSRVDGSRFGGLQLAWTDEAETGIESRLDFAQMQLHLHKLMGITYATDELLNDAAALSAVVERMFALEASFTIEDKIIRGTGAGVPLGVLNSPSLVTVDPEDAQAAATVTAVNVAAMAGRLWAPSHASAVWLFGADLFAQLADASFGNGAPVIVNGQNGQRSILSMPAIVSEYPSAIGEVGDIILADFSQYLIAEKEPDFISSIHVRFLEDETAFRFRWRCDGQPAWATPLTPRNFNLQQSPFVTLGARQ